jgi:hypothetical protein
VALVLASVGLTAWWPTRPNAPTRWRADGPAQRGEIPRSSCGRGWG